MFCQHCGSQLPDGAKFCASCGASVSGLVYSVVGGIALDGELMFDMVAGVDVFGQWEE